MNTSSVLVARLIKQGITWTETPVDEQQHAAKGYIGVLDDWRFVVMSFDIEDQGFSPGSRGYYGTAMEGDSITRLLRDQAETLCKDAESKLHPQDRADQ